MSVTQHDAPLLGYVAMDNAQHRDIRSNGVPTPGQMTPTAGQESLAMFPGASGNVDWQCSWMTEPPAAQHMIQNMSFRDFNEPPTPELDAKLSHTPQTMEFYSPVVNADDELAMYPGVHSISSDDLAKGNSSTSVMPLEFEYQSPPLDDMSQVFDVDTNPLNYVPQIVDTDTQFANIGVPTSNHNGVVKSQNEPALTSQSSPPRSLRKQSESRISLNELHKKMGLENDPGEAKVREARILELLKAEGFDLGLKTWVRDTPHKDRTRIIDRIYEQTYEEFGFDKALIEVIVRRATYYTQQGRLRKLRRKSRSQAASISPPIPYN